MASEGNGWYVADTGAAALQEFLFNDGRGSWDHAPGGRDYAAPTSTAEIWVRDGVVTLAPPGPGRIEVSDVPSLRLTRPRRVRVYLPPAYDRAKWSNRGNGGTDGHRHVQSSALAVQVRSEHHLAPCTLHGALRPWISFRRVPCSSRDSPASSQEPCPPQS